MKLKDLTSIEYTSYLLGIHVGDALSRNLPTLSCDDIRSREIIQVKWAEAKERYRLSDTWFNNQTNENWLAYRKYADELANKYIPKEFDYVRTNIYLDKLDVLKFKEGLSHAIWNCDYSYYDCGIEDIILEENNTDDFNYLVIKLNKHEK
jgi:hypothetical protein